MEELPIEGVARPDETRKLNPRSAMRPVPQKKKEIKSN
jgi:hypothetical protein